MFWRGGGNGKSSYYRAQGVRGSGRPAHRRQSDQMLTRLGYIAAGQRASAVPPVEGARGAGRSSYFTDTPAMRSSPGAVRIPSPKRAWMSTHLRPKGGVPRGCRLAARPAGGRRDSRPYAPARAEKRCEPPQARRGRSSPFQPRRGVERGMRTSRSAREGRVAFVENRNAPRPYPVRAAIGRPRRAFVSSAP